jgi:hypothetical protein
MKDDFSVYSHEGSYEGFAIIEMDDVSGWTDSWIHSWNMLGGVPDGRTIQHLKGPMKDHYFSDYYDRLQIINRPR